MDFKSAVKNHCLNLDNLGIKCDQMRIESQVESWKDWSALGDIEDTISWFHTQKEERALEIEDIPILECRGWSIDPNTGWISHKSKEFFVVQGIRVSKSGTREVGQSGWDQPILTQVGYNGGILGLIRKYIGGVPYYLVEAKAEPGNPDEVQISPTLQATFSNLNKAHGGTKPKFSEYFEDTDVRKECKILFEQWMSEDGGRLHLKRNKGMLVQVPEYITIEVPEGFRWVTLYQLKKLIKMNSWVNPHVRGIISHL
nr:putative monosaccharide biosynthesis protein [Vibrio mimicus]